MAWWEGLAPQQEEPRVGNPMQQFVDPRVGPVNLDGLLADPTQPEPGIESVANWLIPPSRVPAAVNTGVRILGGLPEEQALQGELMGGQLGPYSNTTRIGRQGQTIEGELATAGSAPPGLPAPMSAGRTAGATADDVMRSGQDSMVDWVAGLIRQNRGAAGGADDAAGGGAVPPTGGAGAPPAGGPGRTSLSVAGSDIPKVLRALLPTWLGGEEETGEMPPINVPDTGFLSALGGAGGGQPDFALGPEVKTPRQSLPQVDYENLTEVPYMEALARLEETRPEAPKEQSFLQNLDEWLIPAIAGGLLGGLPGVVLGGLVGEGGRQDRVAGRERAYGEDVADFERGMAEAVVNLMTGQRGQELETQVGQREQALGNFDFDLSQEAADQDRTTFRDDRQMNQMRGRALEAETDALGRQQMLQQLLMTRGVGNDNGEAILNGIVQSNPQLAPIITNSNAYKNWRTNSMEGGDPLMAQANLSQLIQELSQYPEMAQLIQSIKQQQMLDSLLK